MAPFCVQEARVPSDNETIASAAAADGRSRQRNYRLAEDLFEQFRSMSFDGVGISRETYGAGETAAMEVVEQLARRSGFETRWDAARNLIVRMTGRDPSLSVVATGSHLDSVPQGGNYDGAAGVIASWLALLAAQERGTPLRTIELYVLRGEESAWYGSPCYFGSRALFGKLTNIDFSAQHRSSGRTLAHHMTDCGVDLPVLQAQTSLVDHKHFACWLELHIEQGPVLIAKEQPIVSAS